MTDQEIRETVRKMNMDGDLKQALIDQCIENNDPSARFVVYAAARKAAVR